MNYYDRPEWPAFLAAIRAAPTDDLPRLVVADWLDELQTDEASQRAELIRIQVEQWNIGGNTTALTRRAGALTRKNKAKWLRPLRPMEPKESGLVGQYTVGRGNCTMRVICSANEQTATDRDSVLCEFTRGFLRLVSAPLSVLNGSRCEYGYGPHPGDHSECSRCHGTSRTPGVLGELLRREPLDAAGIEVSDATPIMDGGLWFWGKLGNTSLTHAHWLPDAVWQMAYVVSKGKEPGRGDRYVAFTSEPDARVAIAEALIRLHGPKSEVTT